VSPSSRVCSRQRRNKRQGRAQRRTSLSRSREETSEANAKEKWEPKIYSFCFSFSPRTRISSVAVVLISVKRNTKETTPNLAVSLKDLAFLNFCLS